MHSALSTVFAWLVAHEQSLAIWLEGLALVAIFGLELKEYRRQGKDRIEEHKETFKQLGIMQAHADATRDNAIAAKDAAEAAKTNAEAYMVSQRAQLIALLRSGISLFFNDGIPLMPIDIKNIGSTPAYHCLYETWIEVLNVPFLDFTEAADCYKAPFPMTIYPDSPAPTTIHIELGRALTAAELTDFSQGKKSLCFRVRIEYEDAFKKARWCDFGFEFTGEKAGALPKYNDSN